MSESKEELKNLLIRMKEESEKNWLKSKFKKLRSWHLVPSLHVKKKEKNLEVATDFLFLGSEIIVDGDCSH